YAPDAEPRFRCRTGGRQHHCGGVRHRYADFHHPYPGRRGAGRGAGARYRRHQSASGAQYFPVLAGDRARRRIFIGDFLLPAHRDIELTLPAVCMSGRYALFGHPVAHSQSPRIQRAFATQTGIDCAYELIDAPPAAFPAALQEFFAHGGRGANITLPHKETACQLADQLSDRARAAGAVNTLRREPDGRLLGDNTDGIGLVRDLTANNNIKLVGARILICGAGGAARGILPVLLAENPAQLVLANRTHARARELARQFTGCTAQEYAALRGQTFDLVLNATSASL